VKDLSALFGHDDQSETAPRSGAERAELGAALGLPPRHAWQSQPNLDRLVALVDGDDAAPGAAGSDRRARRRGSTLSRAATDSFASLLAVAGGPKEGTRPEGRTSRVPGSPGGAPQSATRRGAGVGGIANAVAAAVAISLVIATATFAVVNRATANPADEAMMSLSEDEASLLNESHTLSTALGIYTQTVSDAGALSESSHGVLDGLEGKVDAATLAAAQSSRASLAAALVRPVVIDVPAYSRGSINERSLADVGKAIDRVRRIRETLPALLAQTRDARGEVTALQTSFRDALRNLGAAIESGAGKMVAENTEADASFRTAVSDAAAQVSSAQESGSDGLAEMSAYSAALDALRAENQRIVALFAGEDEEQQQSAATERRTTRPDSPPRQATQNPSPTAAPPEPVAPTPDPGSSPETTPDPGSSPQTTPVVGLPVPAPSGATHGE
jgi:hypothetical protein